jgi:hypothetical protein
MKVKKNHKKEYEYKILCKYLDNEISKDAAARMLSVSTRTIERKRKRLAVRSIENLYHRNTGKAPYNKLTRKAVLSIVREYKNEYTGENFQYSFADYKDESKYSYSYSTIRKYLHLNNIQSPFAYKTSKRKQHPMRKRRSTLGELVQLDACEMDWCGTGEIWHLHLAVDDATSETVGAYFDKQETLKGYRNVHKQILMTKGIPLEYYADYRTVFKYQRHKIKYETKFGQICDRYGIKITCTHSPQAKGRVEKKNDAFKKRLPQAMRKAGIKTIEEANKFLKQFMKKHNKKFARKRDGIANSYRPFEEKINIEVALGFEFKRTTNEAGEVFINNEYYKIPLSKKTVLNKHTKITLRVGTNQKYYAEYNGNWYTLRKCDYELISLQERRKNHLEYIEEFCYDRIVTRKEILNLESEKVAA